MNDVFTLMVSQLNYALSDTAPGVCFFFVVVIFIGIVGQLSHFFFVPAPSSDLSVFVFVPKRKGGGRRNVETSKEGTKERSPLSSSLI